MAGSVIQLLMDFLGDTNTASALDVVFFVREIMETNQKLRAAILARLLDSFTQIRSSRVCTCSLWIIGEYSDTDANIQQAMEVRAPRPPVFSPPHGSRPVARHHWHAIAFTSSFTRGPH